MILMWLGSFVFVVTALTFWRRALLKVLSKQQTGFLELPEGASVFKVFLNTKLCSLSCAGFLEAQYSAVALLSSRVFSRRFSILLLCLSVVSLWPTMAGFLLSWRLSGEVFFVLAFLAFLTSRFWRPGRQIFPVFFWLGAFLIGMQWLLQKQSILMSLLGESSLHFLLADGRFPAQLLWLTLSFVITWVLAIESWAILLALILVVSGSLSLNGAVGMIIGELLAHVWMLLWRSRKLNQDARQVVKSYALVSTLGLIAAFFAAGFLRQYFTWAWGAGGNLLMEKSGQLLSLYFVVVAIQGGAVLIWGHFAAQKTIEEVQTGDYFPVQWKEQGLIAPRILSFVIQKLQVRLDLLLAQQKQLDAKERAQIPANFLQQHEREILLLSQWISKHSSRS